jgi:hypothetical protein
MTRQSRRQSLHTITTPSQFIHLFRHFELTNAADIEQCCPLPLSLSPSSLPPGPRSERSRLDNRAAEQLSIHSVDAALDASVPGGEHDLLDVVLNRELEAEGSRGAGVDENRSPLHVGHRVDGANGAEAQVEGQQIQRSGPPSNRGEGQSPPGLPP